MKDSYYFPHDYNAHNDPKIISLAMDGWDLVGLYWAVIGMLHEQGGWLNKDPKPIAFALRTQCERIATLIEYPKLFIFDGDMFSSDRVLNNLKHRKDKSSQAKFSADKRWSKDTDANAMRTQCVGNAKKGKERKVYTQPSQRAIFTSPSLQEVVEYQKERGGQGNPEYFIDFYAKKGWKVGKNSMVDWKAAYRNSEKWESCKIQSTQKVRAGF